MRKSENEHNNLKKEFERPNYETFLNLWGNKLTYLKMQLTLYIRGFRT